MDAAAPSLDDLIVLARRQAASDDPVDQLAAAAALKSDLDEVTDALLGHFVDQARRAGASWSRIGEALGVTKQAAQQRHASLASAAKQLLGRLLPGAGGPGSLARFTQRAKAAVVAAQTAARDLGHPYIGTEHLLLGLYDDLEAVGTRVLLEHGVDRARVEATVLEVIGRGPGAPEGHLPFTPRATRALELSLQAAVDLGHNYIGTEHVLLGILDEGDGVGARILHDAGLTRPDAGAAVVRLLASHGG